MAGAAEISAKKVLIIAITETTPESTAMSKVQVQSVSIAVTTALLVDAIPQTLTLTVLNENLQVSQ